MGGPAAHIAMMRDEVVDRRRWLTDREFLDLVGVTNLIPGPNSTEMAIHLGFVRARWGGLLAAGVGFILPAFLITLTLAIAYDRWGTTPTAAWLLYGIKPVVIAVIAQAVWRLGAVAARPAPWLTIGAAAIAGLYLAGINELALLFGGALALAAVRHAPRLLGVLGAALAALAFTAQTVATALLAAASPAREYSLTLLGLTFLKIGALLYGSGYVLVAFLQADFVERLGWLTEEQLIDAVAIGQVTPGPVFSTATFVGYLTGGVPGSIVATAAIFAPSFAYVAALGKLLPHVRRNRVAAALIDGVNLAAIGLMAGVMLQLGSAALVDVPTVLLLGAALLALLRRVNSAWVVVAGGALGLAIRGIGL
jgi:chromate transporter